jgi:hypothetical protein
MYQKSETVISQIASNLTNSQLLACFTDPFFLISPVTVTHSGQTSFPHSLQVTLCFSPYSRLQEGQVTLQFEQIGSLQIPQIEAICSRQNISPQFLQKVPCSSHSHLLHVGHWNTCLSQRAWPHVSQKATFSFLRGPVCFGQYC